MTFQEAIEVTADIKACWKPGLSALSHANRQKVGVSDTNKLSGSVDLDSALRNKYPNDPRWDYGVGYIASTNEQISWIEVHPSTAGSVKDVLAKLEWLRNWLASRAPKINQIPKQFIWISSGRTGVTQNSPQARRCAQKGLVIAGRHFSLD